MKKVFSLILTVFMVAALSVTSLAADGAGYRDNVSNRFEAGNYAVIADDADINDAIAAGRTVTVTGVEAIGNIFAAGQNVYVEDARLYGDIAVAGQNVYVRDIAAGGNVFAAGEKVVIGGHVYGSVYAVCSEIEIEDGTIIEGTCGISCSKEPVIAENASITALNVSIDEPKDNSTAKKTLTAGAKILMAVKSVVYWAPAMMLLSLIISLLFKNNVTAATETLTKRTGATFGFGALALLVFPVAFIIMCITYIGLPLAFILLGIYLLLIFVSQTFTASILGRLIFTDMNVILSGLICTTILVVVDRLPIIGTLVSWACAFVMFGYVVLAFSKRFKKEDKAVNKATAAEAAEAIGASCEAAGVNAGETSTENASGAGMTASESAPVASTETVTAQQTAAGEAATCEANAPANETKAE
ncbi:MAG: polymer-forming cytoskeletal protein [Eubacteriales bacterium]|nr:polymer-forming cytoskeletal protein [Eubacteriales bacterium]